MVKTMTPSATTITSGQVGKLCDLLTAALRKSGLPSEPVQQVLESQGDSLISEFVAAVRRRVEAVSDLIVRRVEVNRVRAPHKALKATGRRQYITEDVVVAMPRGEGEEAEVCFFKLGRYVSDDKLAEEYELRGLNPADPYSLAAVNEDDPTFADEHPNSTHWKDADGKWCYAAFNRWHAERNVNVHVHRRDHDWDDAWWFAGLRK